MPNGAPICGEYDGNLSYNTAPYSGIACSHGRKLYPGKKIDAAACHGLSSYPFFVPRLSRRASASPVRPDSQVVSDITLVAEPRDFISMRSYRSLCDWSAPAARSFSTTSRRSEASEEMEMGRSSIEPLWPLFGGDGRLRQGDATIQPSHEN